MFPRSTPAMLKLVLEKILKTRRNFLLFCPDQETLPVAKIKSRSCRVQVHIFAFFHLVWVIECVFFSSQTTGKFDLSLFPGTGFVSIPH